MECAGKAARPHRTSATGDTSGVGRESGPFGSTRAAATALSPGRITFVGDGCVVQSKAAAGSCHLTDPRLMLRAVGSGKHRGKVAAALQNVRWNPAMIVSSPESIKSQRKDAKKEQRNFASWRHCVLALNGPESERPSIKFSN